MNTNNREGKDNGILEYQGYRLPIGIKPCHNYKRRYATLKSLVQVWIKRSKRKLSEESIKDKLPQLHFITP
eukprot:14124279-Ditylum_brightwellii.AAC.1